MYGLSNAATTPDGVSHWGDTKVIVSLAAAAVLLAAFAVIETRSRYALLPSRVLRSRDRSGAFLISLCLGTALLGMFFFLTVFIQEVWGYSPLKTGVAYLPFVPVMLAATVAAQQARPEARGLVTAAFRGPGLSARSAGPAAGAAAPHQPGDLMPVHVVRAGLGHRPGDPPDR